MKNSITILIATKNRCDLLKNALESVFAQTVKPNQIIIVNDGSVDGTKDFLDKIKNKQTNISVINRDVSGGVNCARNDGIKVNKSKWIAFLDDDDLFVPNAVEIMSDKLLNLSSYGIVFFNTLIKKDNSDFIGGFQFDQGVDEYEPTYFETMTKFRLKGDCKPVFNSDLFINDLYLFPQSVNGFESVVIKKISRDGFKIKYFKDVLTIIDQKSNIDHISVSAPAKNPKAYLKIHEQDFIDNKKFYLENKIILSKKYKEMSKLAFRSGMYIDSLKFIIKSLI